MTRQFEFIVYNRTENEILLDVVRELDTDMMIKDLQWPESHGQRVDLPINKKLFPEIERLILKNRFPIPFVKTKISHITINCKTQNHKYCRGKSNRWGKCDCNCHEVSENTS